MIETGTEEVLCRLEDRVAVVTLHRPEARNALTLEMKRSLLELVPRLGSDDAVGCVLLTGAPPAFCAGGDLKWALSFPQGPSAAFHELAARFHQMVLEIRRMKKPVIAAVNGIAAGAGFTVALACDFRIMARSAIFQQAYTSNGLCIDGGGTFTLPRMVGLARALEIAAFDRPISAEQALAWGLTTEIVEDGQALEVAMNMARELANRSLSSFGWSKQLLTDSFNTSFETHIERERAGLCSCAEHPDATEGMRAFVEKRKPVFNVE